MAPQMEVEQLPDLELSHLPESQAAPSDVLTLGGNRTSVRRLLASRVGPMTGKPVVHLGGNTTAQVVPSSWQATAAREKRYCNAGSERPSAPTNASLLYHGGGTAGLAPSMFGRTEVTISQPARKNAASVTLDSTRFAMGGHRSGEPPVEIEPPGGPLLVRDVAYARSGDKGDNVNIGVLAFDDAAYQLLARALTPARVKAHFGEWVTGPVEVFPMPNILAFNLLLHGALGGGATRTLRFDVTGKAFSTAILRLRLTDGD
jgi:hypothetical protein